MSRPNQSLLEQVRNVIRLKHYSMNTERTYLSWIKRSNKHSAISGQRSA